MRSVRGAYRGATIKRVLRSHGFGIRRQPYELSVDWSGHYLGHLETSSRSDLKGEYPIFISTGLDTSTPPGVLSKQIEAMAISNTLNDYWVTVDKARNPRRERASGAR